MITNLKTLAIYVEDQNRAGVVFLDQPKDMDWGTFATFRDPDGNELVLTSPPRSE